MDTTVFDYENYKDFLGDLIEEKKLSQKGFQKKLSDAAGCQPSYLSQVLHSHAQLTNDHAFAISEFINFSEDERDYFFKLVEHERAATPSYRNHLLKSVRKLKEKRMHVSERMAQSKKIDVSAEPVYYSSWAYGAIHMLVRNPKFQSPQNLANYLEMPIERTLNVLNKLEQIGLLKNQGGKWKCEDNSNLHISTQSPLNVAHHMAWRSKAMVKIQENPFQDIHYTGVYSFSLEVMEWLKNEILDLIQQSREMALPSKDESAAVLLCDFFKI